MIQGLQISLSSRLQARNIRDLQEEAYKSLPAPAYHYLAGGADDEMTLCSNTGDFSRHLIMPHMLNDVSSTDTSTTILGRDVAAPLILSPTGLTQLFHSEAELAVAKAASEKAVFYALSTMGTRSASEVRAVAKDAPQIFQIYIFKDRELTLDLIEAAKYGGFDALCLTVDTPLAGNRERDLVTGMTIPPRLTPRSILQYLQRPKWSLKTLLGKPFDLPNVKHRVDALSKGALSLIDYVNSQFDRKLTWKDFEWLRSKWDGPLIIKGLLSTKDCLMATQLGADAIMLSNHGGRQLDCVPSPIAILPEVRSAIGDKTEIYIDGGIRRGTDIFKAIALGANACCIGRPYLFGLAANGAAGVERAIEILQSELSRNMALAGTPNLSSIDESCITHNYNYFDIQAQKKEG